MKDSLSAALAFAELGYCVFPVHSCVDGHCSCGKESCSSPGKHPRTVHGLNDATTNAATIKAWWTTWPEANLAITTDGLLVVDVDVIDGQPNTWLADQPDKLLDLSRAVVISSTPRGGRHCWFRQPEGFDLRNTTSKIATGVDTRANGGYVLVAPSNVNGKPYQWVEALNGPKEQLSEPPAWLLDLLETKTAKPSVRSDQPQSGTAISSGSRNGTLTSLGGTMRRKGMTEAAISAALKEENRARCVPPLAESEVAAIAKSVSRYEPGDDALSDPSQIVHGSAGRPIITCLANVAPEEVAWLWPGRIAKGKLTMLVGDPGLGKSFLSLDLAARVSKGRAWPDDPTTFAPLASVVLLNAEDALGDTIRPRLDALEADVTKIVAIEAIQDEKRRAVNLQIDLLAIETAIEQLGDCGLIVIDPVSAYLGKVDSHNNADIRALLHPLSDMADRHKVAVLAVSHLNKSGNGSALYRATGSLAFVAAARAAWLLGKDNDRPTRRLFLPMKNNLAHDTSGLAFSIVDGKVLWEPQPVNLTADEVLTGASDVAGWLQKTLAGGPVESEQLFAAAREAGYSQNKLRKAKDKIGAKAEKSGFAGAWQWCLNAKAPEDAPTCPAPEKVILGAFGESSLAIAA